MPFTFAHPAAVLPLKHHFPRIFNLPALVIGSMMPDLGYYLHNWVWSVQGHSFLGSLYFDLPVGLIFLSLFYIFAKTTACLFPYPHREAISLMTSFSIIKNLEIRSFKLILLHICIASMSIIVGAWTHIFWDGFTHANGWCVRQFSAQTPPLFYLGHYQVTIWHIFQHLSSVFGLAIILLSYFRYIHRTNFSKQSTHLTPSMLLFSWSILISTPLIITFKDHYSIFLGGFSIPKLDEFSFQSTVSFIVYFLPLIIVFGIFAKLYESIIAFSQSSKYKSNNIQESKLKTMETISQIQNPNTKLAISVDFTKLAQPVQKPSNNSTISNK